MLVLFVLLLLLPNGCDARKKKKKHRKAAAAAVPSVDAGADAAKAAAEAPGATEASADAGSPDAEGTKGDDDADKDQGKEKEKKEEDDDEDLDEWGEKPLNRTLVESAFDEDDETVAELLGTELPEDDMKPPYEPPTRWFLGLYIGWNPDTKGWTMWIGQWQLDLLTLLLLGVPAYILASIWEWLYPDDGSQPCEESKRFQRNWKRQGLVYACRVHFGKVDGTEAPRGKVGAPGKKAN